RGQSPTARHETRRNDFVVGRRRLNASPHSNIKVHNKGKPGQMFDFRNGKPLMEGLIPEGLSHAATSFVESLKINSITEKAGCARLIDFEIRHEKSLPTTARQADDLLVFLLDMVGRIPNRQWLPFAICFLRAYNDGAVIRELKKRLVVPTGLALIWWNVRTNFTGTAKV